jgi:hypothetical protein
MKTLALLACTLAAPRWQDDPNEGDREVARFTRERAEKRLAEILSSAPTLMR